MYQTEFLKAIKQELATNASTIEAIATALDISYDAAHRRVSLKSKFSIEETIIIAKYFNISLDRLFAISDTELVTIEKTKHIETEDQLQLYFEDSYNSLLPLLKQKGCHILYSAKDIPIFYNLNGDQLSCFKYYVWLKLLNPKLASKSFEDYAPSTTLIEMGKRLGELYNNLNVSEIWDITSVNSTLKQIHYYHQAGQLKTETALSLCQLLNDLISNISNKLIENSRVFKLYYNELHLMNNNVLVSTPNSQLLYVPFTLLSYYKTDDKYTCNEAQTFLEKQLQNSKLLNTSGEKERNMFFNKIQSKIDALIHLIEAKAQLDFE
ncbi:helix-turn-helix domain-containing protein [Winogradskyella immobilis]|uniref:BetR domain-containing protein n=1 Tax=Winogradskyella immobilis TaxID=2816852 RepID=A0ABS8EKX2_9FLAO|nr:hypothetical protein [Winogradskyella immobilis]MCC1483215.1 hypothetical protein [Winogradskyella immobilis]MCG0015309.1 hypothetical protein [Winogradskyella immobilis]